MTRGSRKTPPPSKFRRHWHTDDPFAFHSDYTDKYNAKCPRMERGTVVWHGKYKEPYLFLFAETDGELKFADAEGRFYNYLNHYEDGYLTIATEGQAAQFWASLKRNGYAYKNKKIVKLKTK